MHGHTAPASVDENGRSVVTTLPMRGVTGST